MVTSAARPPLHFQNSILPPPCKNVWMKHCTLHLVKVQLHQTSTSRHSLAEPHTPSTQSARRVCGHGHTKFVLCSGGMWKWWVPHLLYIWISTAKLTMIAKPSIGKGGVTRTGISICGWGLFPVIDRRNICAAEQIWYDRVSRPIPIVAVR